MRIFFHLFQELMVEDKYLKKTDFIHIEIFVSGVTLIENPPHKSSSKCMTFES